MNASTRVVVNTFAQGLRTVIAVCITLYTSRVVLDSLGVNDFGIYSLVGGIMAMFAFIQNNLSTTTQRFLSYYQGRNDDTMVTKVFNNSICTQLLISVSLCLILFLCTEPIFSYVVKIPDEKIETAKIVYWIMLGSLFVNMQSTPYLAALVARENIVYSSIVQVLDALIKLPIALSLSCFAQHRLELYTFMLFLMMVINFLCYYIYCRKKYDKCKHFTFQSFDRKLFREMFSFMGWFVYGTLCITGRTQGIAILLNRFFSTAMNAAYGIGWQVNAQLSFLSNALTTAFNPRIIKTEGEGNRQKMFRLSEISCKFSFLLMSIISVPVIFHIDTILGLWLKEVPENTAMFCTFILIANQIDLISLNLKTANQAIGNVKAYNFFTNTTKLLTVIFVYIVLKKSADPTNVMIVFVIFELICALIRFVVLRITDKLPVKQFIRNVILPVMPSLIINVIVCRFISTYMDGILFLVTGIVSAITVSAVTYLICLKSDEKEIIDSTIIKVLKR